MKKNKNEWKIQTCIQEILYGLLKYFIRENVSENNFNNYAMYYLD